MFSTSPPAVLQTIAKPVRTLEELKGLKIRGTGRIGDLVKTLGATPMPVEMVDLYEALRRHVIDGNFGPMEQLKGFKIGEVIRYTTACWKIGTSYTFYVVMNRSKWNGLPEDIKKIFQETADEFKDKWAVMWNEIEIEGMQFLNSQGGQILQLSDAEAARWVKASQPVVEEFRKDLMAKGYTKKEIDSWLAFAKERIEYWKGQEKEREDSHPVSILIFLSCRSLRERNRSLLLHDRICGFMVLGEVKPDDLLPQWHADCDEEVDDLQIMNVAARL